LLARHVLPADPRDFGRSPPPEAYSDGGLVDAALAVAVDHGCHTLVEDSLAADLALGVVNDPPAGSGAVVLIDGGYMDATTRRAPWFATDASPAAPSAWLAENRPRFRDRDAAVRERGAMRDVGATPEVEVAMGDAFVEVDGEVREAAASDRLADLLLAFPRQVIHERVTRTRGPILLIACGQPSERAAIGRRGREAFAHASPLIEVRVAEEWSHTPPLQDAPGSARMVAEWPGPRPAGKIER
jgi:hypothetical protein